MVTGAIKNKVDKIWTDIWAGGITNPLTVIEQLTYLMFIRSLDEKELATEDFENMAGEKMEHIFPASAAGQSMRWSRFKDKDSREIFLTMQQRVFPAIKKMKYGRLPDFNEKGELVEVLSKLEQAQQEANLVLQWIEGYTVNYPIVFDIEDKCHKNLSNQQLIDIINAFCTTIDAAGYYPMVYSYKNMFDTKLSICGWDRWVAFTLVLLAVALFDFVCRTILVRGMRRIVKRTKATWDDDLVVRQR